MLFLGIATHSRVVEINQAEVELVLAMNRLRHAYLEIAPALERHTLDPLRRTTPRFPTPPDNA